MQELIKEGTVGEFGGTRGYGNVKKGKRYNLLVEN